MSILRKSTLKAISNARTSETEAIQKVISDLPIGKQVNWKHCGHQQQGEIIDHCWDESLHGFRVKVKNNSSKIEGWIAWGNLYN